MGLQSREENLTFGDKLINFNWGLLFLISMIAGVGFMCLYSAGGGHLDPWAKAHMIRYSVGVIGLFITAMIDIRFWRHVAYLFYIFAFLLLVVVEVKGHIGMGAQRWINLGFVNLQPSELMKIALVLALAAFYHKRDPESVTHISTLFPPLFLMVIPTLLVLKQPDLGTALMLMAVGIGMMFLAGVRLWVFIISGISALAAVPVAWQFLHDYQKKRIWTFLNPESDPLGSGYHVTQSKIALGSGGVSGKGFLQGTQSHLNFLPEKQTDFIFTLFAEEWGLLGGITLLALFALLIFYGLLIALRIRHQFGRMLVMGIMINFFLYVFINIAMVMGLLPVVGVPLPLVSYGGTVMLTTLFGFGLVASASIHRDVRMRYQF